MPQNWIVQVELAHHMHLTCDLQNLRCIHALNDTLLAYNLDVFKSITSLFDICNQIKTKVVETTSSKNCEAYVVDRLRCMIIIKNNLKR